MLVYLRGESSHAAIETELRDIAAAMEHRRHDKDVTWADLMKHKDVLVVGTFLVFFQAYVVAACVATVSTVVLTDVLCGCGGTSMTGINTVMLYSAKIFHFAGISNPFLATAVVGFTNVSVTVVSISLVDSYGRRPLLIVGTILMILSLFVLSASLLYLNNHIKTQGVVAVSAVLLFVAGFAIGLGAVVWYVSEHER